MHIPRQRESADKVYRCLAERDCPELASREDKLGAIKGKHEDASQKREKDRMATQAKHEELLAAMKGKAEDAGVKRQAQLLSVKEKGEQAKHKRALEQAKLAAKKQAQPPKKKGDKK